MELSPNLVSSIVQQLVLEHKNLRETVQSMHARLSDMETTIACFQKSSPIGPSTSSDAMASGVPIEPLVEEVQKALVSENSHAIGESTWESVVFAFLPGISCGASFILVLVAILNVLIQGTFVTIVAASFGRGDVTMDKDKAVEFRRSLGHDYNKMDPHRWVSLASRVCGGDESLDIAAGQVSVVNTINEYIGVDIKILGLESVPVGPILCTTVLVVWVLFMVAELREVISFGIALLQIPRRESRMAINSENQFVLASISVGRLAFALSLSLLRLVIAACLMINGCVFVANTAGLENLVLNGVALTFVMDVDELLFNMVVPVEMHAIVHRLEALSRPAGFSVKGFTMWSSGVIFLTVGVVGWAALSPMNDTHEKLIDIREVLCLTGPLEFVVGISSSGIATVSKTRTYDEYVSGDSLLSSVAEEIIGGIDVEETTRGSYEIQTGLTFGALTATLTPADTAEILLGNTPCVDLSIASFPENAGLWYAAAYLANKPNASSCEDLTSLCSAPEGNLVRSYCGQTCNCSSPTSGARNLKYPGCISRCQQEYQLALSRLECSASPVHELIDPVMRAFQWLREDTTNLKLFRSKPESVWTQELYGSIQNGCSGLKDFFDGVKSGGFIDMFCYQGELAPFCPLECGCQSWPFAQKSCPPKCCSDQDYLVQYYSRGLKTSCQNISCASSDDWWALQLCPRSCGFCNPTMRVRSPFFSHLL